MHDAESYFFLLTSNKYCSLRFIVCQHLPRPKEKLRQGTLERSRAFATDTMGRLWESLDDKYRDHLSNICTQEEFEASSIIERAHLRKQFLEIVELQKAASRTEILSVDSDSDGDSDGDSSWDQNEVGKAKIVTPSPSKKRKTSKIAKRRVKEEQGGSEGYKESNGRSSNNGKRKKKFTPSWSWLITPDGRFSMDETFNVNSSNTGTSSRDPSSLSPLKIEANDDTRAIESSVDNDSGIENNLEQSDERKDISSRGATQNQGNVEERKVKNEEEKEAAKKDAYEKYGDLPLLHRFHGINMLGGGTQHTFQRPVKGCKKVFDEESVLEGYPLPKEGFEIDADGNYNANALTALCYNTTWQINGPKFAGQPTAAVNHVPDYMKTEGLVLPIFMKRSMTKKGAARETKVLGWEYCGHYRWVPDDGIMMWEKAENFSQASKNEIAEKTFQSSQSKTGYGRKRLDQWRQDLTKKEKEQKDKSGLHDPNSMISRALRAGFKSDMPDRDLAYLMTELDEFHHLDVIQFVHYDEQMYNYCSQGLTTKNSNGGIHSNDGGRIATARDWYNFRDANML